MPNKTKKALLYMHLLHEPFVVIYALLPFILRKDLGASLIQLSIFAAIRPTLPIFSFYWSANRKNFLKTNLMGAWILARLPFLFVPFVDSIWYLIFSCAIYEFFNKSGIPAAIEILKKNVEKGERENILTRCYVLAFLESIFLGLLIAATLDYSPHLWSSICGVAAMISLSSLFAQWKIPKTVDESIPIQKNSLIGKIVNPWSEAFSTLKTNVEFARFQLGFMMGGFGLMLISPSLAVYYADSLNLSHETVVTGRSILMGLGIILTSYFWKEFLKKHSPFQATYYILIGFGFHPFFLMLSSFHLAWFFLSFIFYGIVQAGSHLLWHLSGTLFAQENDSSPYSRVNILMLGLRGAVAPLLGGVICSLKGPTFNFMIGSCFCFAGAIYIALTKRRITLADTL